MANFTHYHYLNDWQRLCLSVFFFFYHCCKEIILIKNNFVRLEEKKNMAAIN